MPPRIRKFALTAHIIFSVGWIGAIGAFLVLSIAGLISQDGEVVRDAYLSMNLICLYIIVPLSLAALATGLIQSLGTKWGLFEHYWVLVKFLLTILSITVLLMHQFTAMAGAAKLVSGAAGTLPRAELRSVGFVLVRAAGLGILVLLVITALSVYKPWGRTRYGRRTQQHVQRESARLMSLSKSITAEHHEFQQTHGETPMSTRPTHPDPNNEPTLPLGLKIFLGVIRVIVMGFVALHLTRYSVHGH